MENRGKPKRLFVGLLIGGPIVAAAVVLLVLYLAPPGTSIENDAVAAPGPTRFGEVYDLNAGPQTIYRMVILTKENYVHPERIKPKDLLRAALAEIERQIPEVVIHTSKLPEKLSVQVGTQVGDFDKESLGPLDAVWSLTKALKEVLGFVAANTSSAESARLAEYAAIDGMLAALDGQSRLLRPMGEDVVISTKGNFGGLGVVVAIRDKKLMVTSVIDDTPASRAGVRSGDTITRIGKKPTLNMDLQEVVGLLRGEVGSTAKISIRRPGVSRETQLNVKRAIIKISSVSKSLRADGVGYIKIRAFHGDTRKDLADALKGLDEANGKPLQGLVLDLRDNVGGMFDNAVNAADLILAKGTIVQARGEGGKREDTKTASDDGTEPAYPIAVLADRDTQSVAEVFVAALRGNNRAIVLGECTSGDGLVTVMYDFRDRTALQLAIAESYGPQGKSLDGSGVCPDVALDGIELGDGGRFTLVSDEPSEVFVPGQPRKAKRERQPEPATSSHQLIYLDQPQSFAEPSERWPVQFASRLLLAAGTSDADKILRASAGPIAEETAAQDAQLTERLKEQSIDWSAGTADPTDLVAAISVGPSHGLRPGAKARLNAAVENPGQTPAHRITAITRSSNPSFDGIRLMFGLVPAGGKRSLSAEIVVPDDAFSRADSIELMVRSGLAGTTVARSSATANITAGAPPRIGYGFWLDDRPGGNGDGVLQPGEKAKLVVEVENNGTKTAKDVSVRLAPLRPPTAARDAPATFDVSPRGLTFGDIPAGGKKRLFANAVMVSSSAFVPFRISLWSPGMSGEISEKHQLPVGQSSAMKKVNRRFRTAAPDRINIYVAATEESEIVGWLGSNSVVRIEGEAAGWKRIPLPGDRFGFLNAANGAATQEVLSPLPKAFTYQASHSVPAIETAPLRSVTSSDKQSLTGMVSSERGVLDLHVLHNGKKVFFEASLQDAANAAASIPFEVELALKPGSNEVEIVARESAGRVAKRKLGILRTTGE